MLSHTTPILKRSSLAQDNGDDPWGHGMGSSRGIRLPCILRSRCAGSEDDAVVTLVLPDFRPMVTAARASGS